MDERKVERLLHGRAKRLESERLFSAQTEERLREELAREVDREARRRRPRRFTLLAGALAAAAAAVLLFRAVDLSGSADHGAAAVEVALLDSAGRELDSGLRSAVETFERPSELLLELLATEGAHVTIHLYDPEGTGFAGGTVELSSDGERSLAYPLGSYAAHPTGDSLLSFVVVASREAVAPEVLAELLPAQLAEARGPERTAELKGIAATLERELGCTVTLHDLTLDRRGE